MSDSPTSPSSTVSLWQTGCVGLIAERRFHLFLGGATTAIVSGARDMATPHQNWLFSEVAALAERFGKAAAEARADAGTPRAADASAHLSDDGRELIAQGDVAGYYVEARMPWPSGRPDRCRDDVGSWAVRTARQRTRGGMPSSQDHPPHDRTESRSMNIETLKEDLAAEAARHSEEFERDTSEVIALARLRCRAGIARTGGIAAMTKSRNALADTAARIVEAINRLHERRRLLEDAVLALDDRTGTRSASGYETRSMPHNKPRLRSVNGQWLK
ncbi:MAG: hypothetical protein R3F10_06200 [Lysobacteraceae bacterium]